MDNLNFDDIRSCQIYNYTITREEERLMRYVRNEMDNYLTLRAMDIELTPLDVTKCPYYKLIERCNHPLLQEKENMPYWKIPNCNFKKQERRGKKHE